MSDAPHDLPEFLARHPWSTEQLALAKPFDCLWRFELSVPANELWTWISDTSRMNRAMGVSQMQFVEENGVLRGSSRNAGVVHEWVEVPWTWVSQRALESVRVYSRGLAHLVRAIYEIEPAGDGRVLHRVYFGWLPRGGWQRMILKIGMSRLREGYERALAQIEQHVRTSSTSSPFAMPAPPLPAESESRLAQLAERISPRDAPKELVEKLVEWVKTGDEMDLHRMQVLPLSRRWRAPEDELLRVFLHATRAGVLSLSFDVICPHCRGVREEVKTLGELPRMSACQVCKIDFETDRDNAIEITFHVHPSIREVPKLFYCSAEPATKTHIKVQQRVSPGSKRAIATALEPGRYRARIAGQERYAIVDVLDGERETALSWRANQALAGARIAPCPTLVLENPSDQEQTFVVEDARWSDDALRPARLFSFQEFRDLFTDEYLGVDIQLSVGKQTILFTDVVGSTRLYATRGDPGAFMDVKRHFTEIYEEVRNRGGAIVKTIGDAAMAAFVDPVRALEAARAIHAHFPPGRRDLALRVRISLNTGPCIAVKLNTNIDYFGNTVNLAAKLQSVAGAGQISFTEEVLDQPGVAEYLAAQNAALERLTLDSPSLAAPVAAVRWSTDP